MKILVIDDDLRHGESLVDLLSTKGHEAYFAPDEREAEWLTGLFRFDLSVIDREMPRAPGPEVARRLIQRTPELEVVIISANFSAVGPDDRLEGLPFFSKPIEIANFLAYVDRVISRRRGLPLILREKFSLEIRDLRDPRNLRRDDRREARRRPDPED